MEVTKIKLLRVLDILKDTDEDHPITTNQIIEQLKLYGILPFSCEKSIMRLLGLHVLHILKM